MLTRCDKKKDANTISSFKISRYGECESLLLAIKQESLNLSTKANLVARGILASDAQVCVSGCGEVETAQHLFVSCPIFRDLWHHVRQWIVVSGVDPFDIAYHFLQFTYIFRGQQNDAPLCNFCGCLVCGCYGLNVIIGSLITPNILFISWSKMSKFIHIGGWRRQMLFLC